MPDGARYEGEWRYGRFMGRGRRYSPNGSVLEGVWYEGQLRSFGRSLTRDPTSPAGWTLYEGGFIGGTKHGLRGRCEYPDGSIYVGDFAADRPHGSGVLRYADGAEFAGPWRFGLKHGHAIERGVEAGLYEGRFEAGRRHGIAIFVDTSTQFNDATYLKAMLSALRARGLEIYSDDPEIRAQQLNTVRSSRHEPRSYDADADAEPVGTETGPLPSTRSSAGPRALTDRPASQAGSAQGSSVGRGTVASPHGSELVGPVGTARSKQQTARSGAESSALDTLRQEATDRREYKLQQQQSKARLDPSKDTEQARKVSARREAFQKKMGKRFYARRSSVDKEVSSDSGDDAEAKQKVYDRRRKMMEIREAELAAEEAAARDAERAPYEEEWMYYNPDQGTHGTAQEPAFLSMPLPNDHVRNLDAAPASMPPTAFGNTAEIHLESEFGRARGQGDKMATRRGVWNHGHFVRWLSAPVTIAATAEFCARFQAPEDFLDMYAMLVARQLPALPDGVDAENTRVRTIVAEIVLRAQPLVAVDRTIELENLRDSFNEPIRKARLQLNRAYMRVQRMEREVRRQTAAVELAIKNFEEVHAEFADLYSNVVSYWRRHGNGTAEEYKRTVMALQAMPRRAWREVRGGGSLGRRLG